MEVPLINLLAMLLVAQDADVKIAPATDKGFAKFVATSKTYEVSSDAPAEITKEVARILENLHQAFVTEFKIDPEKIEVPLLVSFYATDAAFRKAQPQAPPMMGGFYESGSKRLHCEMQQPDVGD